jgi:hypothetical protein
VLVMLISLTYTLVNYVDESYSDHAIDHIHAGARTAECFEKAAGQLHKVLHCSVG